MLYFQVDFCTEAIGTLICQLNAVMTVSDIKKEVSTSSIADGSQIYRFRGVNSGEINAPTDKICYSSQSPSQNPIASHFPIALHCLSQASTDGAIIQNRVEPK
jgi:hypothetical protein